MTDKQINTCEFLNICQTDCNGTLENTEMCHCYELYKQLKCKEQECEKKSQAIGNLGYKIKNQRKEINIRLEQLDQLKAENEELKEKIKAYDEVYSNHYVLIERNKYKQTLTEIEEIAEKAAKCLYATESDDYTDGYRWLGSIILQKIRKCEMENEADRKDIGMSKYENDPQYEHKFFVVKDYIIQQELDFLRCQKSVAYHNVLCFLKNVANRAKDKEYLVINQDEPYADKVWELIKQGEKKSNK